MNLVQIKQADRRASPVPFKHRRGRRARSSSRTPRAASSCSRRRSSARSPRATSPRGRRSTSASPSATSSAPRLARDKIGRAAPRDARTFLHHGPEPAHHGRHAALQRDVRLLPRLARRHGRASHTDMTPEIAEQTVDHDLPDDQPQRHHRVPGRRAARQLPRRQAHHRVRARDATRPPASSSSSRWCRTSR